MAIITRSKINDNNVWVKAIDQDTKSEAKFFMSMSNVNVKFKCTAALRGKFERLAKLMNAEYEKNSELSPTDIVNNMEQSVKAEIEKI